jgi:aminoacyl tRNA synthase complex-interacting multifunctional protein 2
MYKIKPINQIWPNLDMPDCMYNMKSVVNLKLEECAEYPNINIEMNEIDKLAGRQEKILLQLEEFKKQLQNIKSGLNSCSKPAQSTPGSSSQGSVKTMPSVVQKPIDIKQLRDLVVNANPRHIPYSILALKNLWKDRLNINVEFFTHSSVPELTNDVQNFINRIKSMTSRSELPSFKITIIWKAVESNIELIVTPTTYGPLLGEASLIRYLSRVGPNEFNYESNSNNATETDAMFDMCYLLANAVNDTRERQKQLRLMNIRLGKQQLYGGSSVSVVDVVVSSTIKQLNITKDLTPAMKQWFDRTTPLLGY